VKIMSTKCENQKCVKNVTNKMGVKNVGVKKM